MSDDADKDADKISSAEVNSLVDSSTLRKVSLGPCRHRPSLGPNSPPGRAKERLVRPEVERLGATTKACSLARLLARSLTYSLAG